MPYDGEGGILFIPDGLTAVRGAFNETDFEKALIKAMTEPIESPSSPSHMLPHIVKGPASAIAGVKVIKLPDDPWEALISDF